MEDLIAAIITEEEEDNDLLVYCMSDSATEIFKKRKDERYQSSLIGRYLMDNEMEFGEFFKVSRDIFHFMLKEIKGDIIPSRNRWHAPISAEQKLGLTQSK